MCVSRKRERSRKDFVLVEGKEKAKEHKKKSLSPSILVLSTRATPSFWFTVQVLYRIERCRVPSSHLLFPRPRPWNESERDDEQ